MHTWLPDAHAEAPSPASAMLSAALLNTGMYAIIRFLAIAHGRLGSTYPRAVLLFFGFASIVIGALFMVRRGNFKRLFAYSSVEHMGIIAVALGFGGTLGLYGALLQTLNHALAKAVLFLSSGDVSLRYKTREAGQVSGLLAAVPVTGGALLLATFAVLGSPPFGLFLSELTIVPGRLRLRQPGVPAAVAGPARAGVRGLRPDHDGNGDRQPAGPAGQPVPGRSAVAVTAAPLVLGLAALLVLGLWIPAGLDTILRHSIVVIGL